MLDCVTYRNTEREEKDLSSSVESGSKDDIANGPPVFERSKDKDELWDDVDRDADQGPQDVNDIERDRRFVGKTKELFEGGNGDEERCPKDKQTRDAKKLFRRGERKQAESGLFQRSWQTHKERGVPSSANWKPTNPLMSKQQYVAATRPVYIAANHYYINNVNLRVTFKEKNTNRICCIPRGNDARV